MVLRVDHMSWLLDATVLFLQRRQLCVYVRVHLLHVLQ